MRMAFGVSLGSNLAMDDIAGHSRVAEESGFSHLGFVDQPFHDRDPWVSMTVAALNTTRILIGQTVTDPFAHHPLVIANATASVDELSGGRAFVGIGAGGAGAKAIFKPVALQELKEAVQFIQRVTTGQEANFKGVWVSRTSATTMHSVWMKRRIPVYWAANGLKSAEMAGEVADGVLISGGHPELVRLRLQHVEKGALRAGRDPSEIDIWMRTMIYVAESKEASRQEMAAYTATQANALYKFALRDPEVARLLERTEPGIIDEMRRIHNAYRHYEHERRGASHSQAVTQRVIDFFNLTGNSEDVCDGISRFQELRTTRGARISTLGLAMYTIDDQIGMMREIGSQIVPMFAD